MSGEQELRGARSRLEALIGSLQGALLVEDEERRIVRVNRQFCELFSIPVPADALIGADCSNAAEQSKQLFADPERFVGRIDEILAGREPVIDESLGMADGRIVERDYIPVFVDGTYRGHLWHYRDVTRQVYADRRQRCLLGVSVALGSHGSGEDAARGVLSSLGGPLQWSLGAFWRLDAESGRFRCAATWAAAGEPPERVAAYEEACRAAQPGSEQPLVSRLWASREALWVREVATEPGFLRAELARRHGLGAGLFVPVRGAGRSLSMLEWIASVPRDPEPEVARLANHIAGQLGRFLDGRESQDALRASEARSRAILDSALDAIVTIDHEGRVAEFNAAAERLFGHRREDVLGRGIVDVLVPQELREAHRSGFARSTGVGAASAGGRRLELSALRADGSTFPAEVSIARIEHEGPAAFTGFIRDITERREVERLKKQFVATVSHELRTPLTSIRGSLGLLAAGVVGPLPDEARELVAIAERNTTRLIGLINEILDLERLESGRLPLELAPTRLDAVLRRAVETVEGLARDHGVTLELPATAAVVVGDEGRLVQVVVNLVSNAVRFSPRGSRVALAVRPAAARWRVEVSDEGRGVPAELRRRIFEPFFQAEGSDARKKGGSGLGLAICRALIEQHGGEIAVDPRPGGGSVFWFTVPGA